MNWTASDSLNWVNHLLAEAVQTTPPGFVQFHLFATREPSSQKGLEGMDTPFGRAARGRPDWEALLGSIIWDCSGNIAVHCSSRLILFSKFSLSDHSFYCVHSLWSWTYVLQYRNRPGVGVCPRGGSQGRSFSGLPRRDFWHVRRRYERSIIINHRIATSFTHALLSTLALTRGRFP